MQLMIAALLVLILSCDQNCTSCIDGECKQCIGNYILDANNQCVPLRFLQDCPEFCECEDGVCKTCANLMNFNGTTCECKEMSSFVDGKCQCNRYYIEDAGTCRVPDITYKYNIQREYLENGNYIQKKPYYVNSCTEEFVETFPIKYPNNDYYMQFNVDVHGYLTGNEIEIYVDNEKQEAGDIKLFKKQFQPTKQEVEIKIKLKEMKDQCNLWISNIYIGEGQEKLKKTWFKDSGDIYWDTEYLDEWRL